MCRLLPSLFALSALAALHSAARGQAPVQSAPQPKAQATPAQSGITIKTHARIVIEDVVVTDNKQRPVHNLKQSDFNLLEANAPQTITHFEEHIYPDPNTPPAQFSPVLPPGTFTNYSSAPSGGSLNVILLDTLNTPTTDQVLVRDQLKKFLNSTRPGAPIAIFGLNSRLIMLQGFTSNPDLLKAIIDKKNPIASPLLDGTLGDTPGMGQVIANFQEFEARRTTFQVELRAKSTLDAMNLMARYLAGFPGRKNIIWFSGSFPLTIEPNGIVQNSSYTGALRYDSFAASASFGDELLETTNLLSVAQVAVYPIDARALMISPDLSAANSGRNYTHNPRTFDQNEYRFNQQTDAEHGTMQQMAEDTGGQAFFNTNDLSHAVAAAIDNGSNYYSLTYSPSDTTWNSKFRKIQIKMQQRGLNLAYRRGYYATDPAANALKAGSSSPSATAENASVAPVPPDPMRPAMMRGSPDPTQVIFRARVLPVASTTEDILANGNVAGPDAKLTHGPYRRYQIDLAADPRAFRFNVTSDGVYHAFIQLRTYVYDQDGALIVSTSTITEAKLTAAGISRIYNGGAPFSQQISVPDKGTYYLRIGIHDLTSDHIGAIEIPVASVRNLTPLPPPASPAPPIPPQ